MGTDQYTEDNLRRRTTTKTTDDISNELSSTSYASSSKEDVFDAEITTLPSTTRELIETQIVHLSHTETLQNLKEIGSKTPILPSEIGTDFSYKRQVVWSNALGFFVLHLLAAIGVGLIINGKSDYRTFIYSEYPNEMPGRRIHLVKTTTSSCFCSTFFNLWIRIGSDNGCPQIVVTSIIQGENTVENVSLVAAHTSWPGTCWSSPFSRWSSKYWINFFLRRTACTFGFAITDNTTNTLTQTLIHTMPIVDSSSAMSAGSCPRNIPKLLNTERRSTCPI